jgi:hypothetical protein
MGTNNPRDDDEPSDRQIGVSGHAEYRPDEERTETVELRQ